MSGEVLPQGLKVTRVYSIPNYLVHFEFLSYEENDIDTLVIHRQQNPREEAIDLIVPKTQSDAMKLSTALGVDESMRKFLMEMTTPVIKGLVIQNHIRGIMCIIQKPISGISGKDGMSRTVEHLYSIPVPNPARGITLTPMFYAEDLNQAPQYVYDTATEYLTTVMSHIKAVNDRMLDKLYSTYGLIQQFTNMLGERLENINDEYYNQLKSGDMRGVLSNEESMGRLGSFMTFLVERLKTMINTET